MQGANCVDLNVVRQAAVEKFLLGQCGSKLVAYSKTGLHCKTLYGSNEAHGAFTALAFADAVSILGFAGFTGGHKAVPATAVLTMVLWPLVL